MTGMSMRVPTGMCSPMASNMPMSPARVGGVSSTSMAET